MTKKHEELVEEIGRAISEHRREPPYGEIGGDDMQLARDIIARIGKAYADGMPLPRQAGHIKWYSWYPEPETPWMQDMVNMGATLFIALCKEED